jgi:hypothetical protein
VPHTEIIGNGYTSIVEIENDTAQFYENKYTSNEGKIVNTSQIAINVSITSFLAAGTYLFFMRRKPKQTVVENTVNTNEVVARATQEKETQLKQALQELEIIKVQNMCMSLTIEELQKKNNEYLKEETKQMPILDINALAFADDETIMKAQLEYAKKMAEYVKRKDSCL